MLARHVVCGDTATPTAAETAVILARNKTLDAPLRIHAVEHDGSIVLAVEGELDILTSPLLDEALSRARATDAMSIVIDLFKVSFIDSTGLHVLFKHAQAEEGRARLHLTRGSPQAQRVFELSGVKDYLPFI